MNDRPISSMFQAKLLADMLHAQGQDDEALIADMIEGETNALNVVDRIVAEIGEAEQHQAVLRLREDEMAQRRQRYAAKAEGLRLVLLSWMGDVGLPKLERPEATLSIKTGGQGVSYSDDFGDELPEAYVKTLRSPDKAAVRKAVLAGEVIPGATLSNSPPTLTIRRS